MSLPEFDRVLAEPGSRAARRALATAWETAGDPRGTLIRLELEIDEAVRANPYAANAKDTRAKRVEIDKLQMTHGAAKLFGNAASLVDSYELVWGMIGRVRVAADKLAQTATKLFGEAPVQHVIVTNAKRGWSALVRSPYLVKLTSLAAVDQELGDREAIELAGSPHASELRWIDLAANRIDRPGVDALAASAHLANVVFLNLSSNPCDPSPVIYDNDATRWVERPPIAEELIRLHGERPWLAGPAIGDERDWPPRPDDLAVRP
jgi:hypothetical protein